jgi:hypothetical protein
VETRWATTEDFALIPKRKAETMRGLTLVIGGKPVAIASMFRERGSVMQTVAVDYIDRQAIGAVTLHRFGRMAVKAAKDLGIRRFLARADCAIPRSEAWLERLGLSLFGRDGEGAVYLHER